MRGVKHKGFLMMMLGWLSLGSRDGGEGGGERGITVFVLRRSAFEACAWIWRSGWKLGRISVSFSGFSVRLFRRWEPTVHISMMSMCLLTELIRHPWHLRCRYLPFYVFSLLLSDPEHARSMAKDPRRTGIHLPR